MLIIEYALAKKYAHAFLNIYKKKFNPEYVKKLEEFALFLNKNHFFQATLSIPSIPLSKKQEIVERISQKLNLSPCIKKLILVLLNHGRIELINNIFSKILLLYKQYQNEQFFIVDSSHELTQKEKNKITDFIKSKVDSHLIMSFNIDQTLISGIRIKSDNFLLEHSIAKQLKIIKQTLLRQEKLC